MWQRLGILRKLCWLSLALCLTFAGVPDTASGDAEGWLVRGGNARRTGRAQVAGPQSGRVAWSYLASDGLGIHMEPTVTRDGVFFGTWGLIRKHGESPASWDRFDGAIVGLELGSGRPLWEPVRPGVTPYAYAFAGRKATLQDRGAGKGLHMSAYNGTVEGSAAVDPDNGTLYFGRGDGRLYAVDPRSGAIAWSFQTGDPARSDDPESGGQIVGGPLLTPGGSIVFATYGVPASDEPPGRVRHQTHAIYAVNRDGTLRWRHPAQGSLPNPFMAPVALSRSGKRLYAITLRADTRHPAHLLALDAESGEPIWEMTLDDRSGQDLAVGVDGRIYVAGLVEDAFGRKPAAFAVVDQGQRGGLAWTTSFAADRPRAHGAGGLALDEDDVAVRHVYVSTTNAQDSSARGGRLHRLDPATGEIGASFDPQHADPRGSGGFTDVTLDSDGTIYAGTRGSAGGLLRRAVQARMYALRLDASGFGVLWSVAVVGSLDGASPAIGPDGGLYFGSTAALRSADPLEPRPASQAVPGADPVFYAVRDAPSR